MYVAPNKNMPGLKARTRMAKEAAEKRAQVQAEVEATRKRSQAQQAVRLIAGK